MNKNAHCCYLVRDLHIAREFFLSIATSFANSESPSDSDSDGLQLPLYGFGVIFVPRSERFV
jgi:hypothetical protein